MKLKTSQALENFRSAHTDLAIDIRARLKIAEEESRQDHGMDSRFLLTGEMHYRHEDNSFWLQYTAKFGDGTQLEDCWASLDIQENWGLGGGLIYCYSGEDMRAGQY